ncbi:MAG: hypothetical protein ACP5H2_10490 [Solirubrobacteraceae bacterium]
MNRNANSSALRLARVARELVTLAESADAAPAGAYALARATMVLEADVAQVRAALTGGAR